MIYYCLLVKVPNHTHFTTTNGQVRGYKINDKQMIINDKYVDITQQLAIDTVCCVVANKA